MGQFQWRSLVGCLLAGALACSGDAPATTAEASAPIAPDKYAEQQKAFADSVIRSVVPADRIAKEIKHTVGPQRMQDSIAALVSDSTGNCFARGRESDPYLSGAVNFWVYMSVLGADQISVYKSQWTSPAGRIVDECFTLAAAKWQLPADIAPPGPYLVQLVFKQVPPKL